MGTSRSKHQKPSPVASPTRLKGDVTARRTSSAAKENKLSHAPPVFEEALATWENEGGLVQERSQPRHLPRTEPEASQTVSISQQASPKSLPLNPVPYKAVLAAALDPIITVDGAGIIQSVSNSVQRMFGWTPAELVGRNVSILMPEPHRSEHDGYLAEYHKTGRTEHLNRARRFEAVRKDGTFFPIEVCVSRVDLKGHAPLFVGIIRDLINHDRVSAGNGAEPGNVALEAEDNTQLHELLAEQTAALQAAHLRLRMSDRMASIGALAAGLGHDMNNVLLPVRAHLNAARALTMIPEVRKHVLAVQKSVVYLQQLADALHFLAFDTDGKDDERGATDVRAWWSQVGPFLAKAVPKHVKVVVSLPKGLPEVAISAHGLTQAVLNLVVNAGQAIPAPPAPGQGRERGRKRRQRLVRIWAESIESDGGGRVRVGVTDNGVGMSAEVQRNAFEMFYTTKTRGLGTGLGLPLVAKVVSRAGGSVHIDSALGKGTTVEILLPVAAHETRRSDALAAVVTLTDGRAAVLIQHLLEVAGVRTALGTDPTGADIWIMEPTKGSAAGAKAWRKRHPHSGLVLFGKPASGSARAWSSLHPDTIEDPDDLDAIRIALSRVIAGS